MTLGEACADLPVSGLTPGAVALQVQGVCHDSRRVRPGDLFVAWAGDRFDARRFAAQAVAQGAVAVLADAEPAEPVPAPWLVTPSPRRLMAELAGRVYRHPDRELRLVGITGTNGKTTISYLVAAIFEHAGYPCGVMGTLGYRFGSLELPGDRTTPEASDFFGGLRAMRDAGAAAASVEVSSHALDQGRVGGARFEAAVFTNLTRDHLDYHGDYETYYAAKRRLFDQLVPGGHAVLNLDDPYGRRLVEEVAAPQVRYGEREGDVYVERQELTARSTRARLRTRRGPLEVETRLLGRYNLWNILAAVGVAEALGLAHEAVREALAAFPPVSGRMEPIDAGQPFPVLVDYAHTDAGLDAALRSLRELWPGRIVVVFGAGGNKDRGKRPLMGAAVAPLSDLAVITDDNPRDEDPASIRDAVLQGFLGAGGRCWESIGDRRAAIRRALELAEAEGDWAVLVAGKGHESSQVVGGRSLPFSDQDEVRKALGEMFGAGALG